MNREKVIELLKENEDRLGVLNDKKTLDTLIAMKQVFAERFLERGDMKFLILNSVANKPKHGYQIIMSISRKFDGFYKPSPGVVYPTLQSLEEEGMIHPESISGKKTYIMTNKGEAYLKKNKKRVDEIFANFKECHFLKDKEISKKFEELGNLWVQIAYEVYFKSMMCRKSGAEDLGKRMDKLRDILENTLKETKEVWG